MPSHRRQPCPAAQMQLMARRRSCLAAAAASAAAPLPEEHGEAPAYPGDAVRLRADDVRTWLNRMQQSVHWITPSLQQQLVILALANQLSWQAGGGAEGRAVAALDHQECLYYAAMLETCCGRLRCATLCGVVQEHCMACRLPSSHEYRAGLHLCWVLCSLKMNHREELGYLQELREEALILAEAAPPPPAPAEEGGGAGGPC